MRTIILDTETTGLSTKLGHKIIEIGCIEMIDRIETGNVFHTYVNPKRDVPESSTKIHGITNEKLLDKPIFAKIAGDFLDFIGNDSKLIIHNATFDIGFLNFELSNTTHNQISADKVIDTLQIARKKFPGSSASLDALCKRFNISLEHRKYHGALLDSQLLARVYLELTKENQSIISFSTTTNTKKKKKILPIRKFSPSQEELNSHKELIKKIKKPLWKK
ncbi:MAG: DNA polymerase III subunit epsilon [Rickettsiaceae bacterium H1]|nr:DNA polymerase III subunit epsilon [Rickettsiaceae bacterium H1]